MKLSVIVCTYNRAHQIGLCLDSIRASLEKAAPVDAEIVVVNNASKDNTIDVVTEWAKASPFPVRLVTETRQGIGPARNCGLRSASGDLFVCTDDDCRLDEDHISRALDYYRADEEPVLRYGGVHLGDPADWPMTVHTSPHRRQWQKGRPEWGFPAMGNMIGCNFAMPREIFEKIGYYDELFGTKSIPGGEDADYGFRVFHAGYRMEFVPDMIVRHFHGRRDAESVWKLIKGYQISAGALYAKHGVNHPHIKRIFAPKPTEPPRAAPARTDERSATIHAFHKKAKIFYLTGLKNYMTGRLRLALRKGCGKDKSEETVRAAS